MSPDLRSSLKMIQLCLLVVLETSYIRGDTLSTMNGGGSGGSSGGGSDGGDGNPARHCTGIEFNYL